MTILDTLIKDRTQDDVEQAIAVCARSWDGMTRMEREAYQRGLKGGYGAADMNRVVGAMEYIDRLITDAKRESVYQPVTVQHAEFDGTAWNQWNDTVWVASDYVTPVLWAVHLENINRFWDAARRFEAAALARYDPNGYGYISPETVVDTGTLFTVTDSVGLLELRVEGVCPPSVTAEGMAWTVQQTDTGWVAVLDYSDCPYPDIDDALAALRISCGADGITDGEFTLSAVLRYDYDVTVGTCRVRWSSIITWGEALDQYATWGGTKPLAWGEAARGDTP